VRDYITTRGYLLSVMTALWICIIWNTDIAQYSLENCDLGRCEILIKSAFSLSEVNYILQTNKGIVISGEDIALNGEWSQRPLSFKT